MEDSRLTTWYIGAQLPGPIVARPVPLVKTLKRGVKTLERWFNTVAKYTGKAISHHPLTPVQK